MRYKSRLAISLTAIGISVFSIVSQLNSIRYSNELLERYVEARQREEEQRIEHIEYMASEIARFHGTEVQVINWHESPQDKYERMQRIVSELE